HERDIFEPTKRIAFRFAAGAARARCGDWRVVARGGGGCAYACRAARRGGRARADRWAFARLLFAIAAREGFEIGRVTGHQNQRMNGQCATDNGQCSIHNAECQMAQEANHQMPRSPNHPIYQRKTRASPTRRVMCFASRYSSSAIAYLRLV